VSTPAAPDPAQVQRGAVALSTALRLSTLLPHEQAAIFSILRTLNAADEQLRGEAGEHYSHVYVASVLATILDTYRRELANLDR
jgi:hypothetical protein